MIKKILNKEFILFFSIGIFNTLNDQLMYNILLSFFKIDYKIATNIAFVYAMIISFFLNTYVTFKTKPTFKKFIMFPISSIPTWIFKNVGNIVLVEMFHVNERITGFITSIFSIPFSFLLSKFILKSKDE